MAGGMSRKAKRELLASIQHRYQESSKRDKGRILDEFIAVTGHHRKHGIRLLGRSGEPADHVPGVKGRQTYDEAVREPVILVQEVRPPDVSVLLVKVEGLARVLTGLQLGVYLAEARLFRTLQQVRCIDGQNFHVVVSPE